MQLKQIKIGNLHTENNIFLAPLAGYTNSVFRDMCFSLGAGLTFTEMVSAKGLLFNSEKTRQLLHVSSAYAGIKACQLFGNDPKIMRQVAESERLKDFDLIDINMGCPMPKIVNNGEGSALMANMPLAKKIIEEVKKSGKFVSVKFRLGIKEGEILAPDFAKVCEDGGADMICVHGRSREKIYAGEVNFDVIAACKNAVKIPVIANGGVFSKDDAKKLLDYTGADGIAIARGAIYAPWLFSEILEKILPDKKTLILKQLQDTYNLYGEHFTCVFMRKMIAFYLHNHPHSAPLKLKLFSANTCEEVKEILSRISFD